MTVGQFTESLVEQAALAWLESPGFSAKHGPEVASGAMAAEDADSEKTLLEQRLLDALARLCLKAPGLISGALRVPDTERPIEKVM